MQCVLVWSAQYTLHKQLGSWCLVRYTNGHKCGSKAASHLPIYRYMGRCDAAEYGFLADPVSSGTLLSDFVQKIRKISKNCFRGNLKKCLKNNYCGIQPSSTWSRDVGRRQVREKKLFFHEKKTSEAACWPDTWLLRKNKGHFSWKKNRRRQPAGLTPGF